MENENKNKIVSLENRVKELEDFIRSLKLPGTIPNEIVEAFIGRGFMNVGTNELVVYYEGGVGGNLFTEKYRTTRYGNKTEYLQYPGGIKLFTVNTTSNVCQSPNHGFLAGQYVVFRSTGTIPAGLDSLVDTYTILSTTQDTFEVTTDGINPVDITDVGVGQHYAFAF